MAAIEAALDLRRVTHALEAGMSRTLEEEGLSLGRWHVLAVCWTAGGPVAQQAIVEALGVSRANVSSLVGGLVSDGFVGIAPDPDDRRQVLVALTGSGAATTARLMGMMAGRMSRHFLPIADRIGHFRDLLGRIDLAE